MIVAASHDGAISQDRNQLATNNLRNQLSAPRAPFGPRSPDEEKYIDDLLRYWEFSSGKIKRYRCQFTRWEYDPVFGPGANEKGIVPAKTIAVGAVQYETPDKGMYEVQKLYDYGPPREPGGEPQYDERKEDQGEKWICDGQHVYEFDYPRKRLIVRELSPDMRGKAIADGPLPFLFGVQAAKVKERYWLRVITPKTATKEYWLEAWPKRHEDAANFKKVEVIIDETDFLPKAIQIFATNYDPRTNQSRTAFTFENRDTNANNFNLNIFQGKFHKPKTPSGWTAELIPFQAPQIPDSASRSEATPRR